MWKLVIPALAVALTGCGGGGEGSGPTVTVPNNPIQAAVSMPVLVSKYKNEIGSSQIFNSAVADLNGDGLDDIVVSGWAVAPTDRIGSRSGFVNLKVLIQQDDGSLVDKTDDLIGAANSVIWGSQRILINDLDGDGRPDIAVLGFQDGPLAVAAPSVVFWNLGKSFARTDLPEQVIAHAACAGDLNGDGLPELVTGGDSNRTNTIYSNRGRQQLIFDHTLTQQAVSAMGTCAVLRDNATGNVAIVTTNLPNYPNYSAVMQIWDRNFNFVATRPLPSSEEPGTNIDLTHDIINLIPVDINGDGLVDIITTDGGDWKIKTSNGYMSVLINQGDFIFKNQTAQYLPNQSKTMGFATYYTTLTINGYPSIFLDHGPQGVSLWQIKNNSIVRYQERLLNSLVEGYSYTNIYRTKKGLSLFLMDTADYPYAKFYYRHIDPNAVTQ